MFLLLLHAYAYDDDDDDDDDDDNEVIDVHDKLDKDNIHMDNTDYAVDKSVVNENFLCYNFHSVEE
jgi:hypothetical protein